MKVKLLQKDGAKVLGTFFVLTMAVTVLTGCKEKATKSPEPGKTSPTPSATATPAPTPTPVATPEALAPETTATDAGTTPSETNANAAPQPSAPEPNVPNTGPSTGAGPADLSRNGLAVAPSPYLRRLAQSPVHWQLWSPEVLAVAREAGKPLVISVGANWSEPSQAMDAVTFADPEVADLLNREFVAIKVDALERPDLHARVQAAYELINRKAADLPLLAFALPDGSVFDALAVVGPETEGNRKGLRELLPQARQLMETRRDDVVKQAAQIRTTLDKVFSAPAVTDGAVVDKTAARASLLRLRKAYDMENGGFKSSDGRKYPNGAAVSALLQHFSDSNDVEILNLATRSLLLYIRSGLRDHIMGGYFRLCDDAKLTRPSHEKLLPVQAELLSAFSQAFAATKRNEFKQAAAEVVKFSRDFLEDENGGFYSLQESIGSHETEPTYFTVTLAELEQILGTGRDAEVFANYLGVQPGDARSAPRADGPLARTAEALGISRDEAQKGLDEARRKLHEERMSREQFPPVDKSIVAGWNGAMISAYFDYAAVANDADAAAFARKSLDTLKSSLVAPDGAVRRLISRGQPAGTGLIEDYVSLANAFLDGYQFTGQTVYLDTARAIMTSAEAQFLDANSGLYLDRPTSLVEPTLSGTPLRPLGDGILPSPNGLAAIVWLKLHAISGDNGEREKGMRLLQASLADTELTPPANGTLARAASLVAAGGPVRVNIVSAAPDEAAALRTSALGAFRAGKVVVSLAPDAAAAAGKDVGAGPAAWVSVGGKSTDTITDPAALAAAVSEFERPKRIEPAPTAAPASGRSSSATSRTGGTSPRTNSAPQRRAGDRQ